MTNVTPQQLVLAIHLFSRGFAFVLFEGPESPFEWGVKEIKLERNTRTLKEIRKLIDRYRPEALVIEDMTDRTARRKSRMRKLQRMLTHLAMAECVDLHRYRRTQLLACFASVGARTKHEIAQAIAIQIPAFAHRMPRFRKPWMGEDPRQSLFDAAALGLTHFACPQFVTDDSHPLSDLPARAP